MTDKIGVKEITTGITAETDVSPAEVKEMIEEALRRSAELVARRITVETQDSIVILHGAGSHVCGDSWIGRRTTTVPVFDGSRVTPIR